MTDTLTEDDINALHKQEHAEAAAIHGRYSIPWAIVQAIGERTRLRWVALLGGRDGSGEPITRHDKTDKLSVFVRKNPNLEVTVEELMDAADCSKGTAHKFIADNRSSFIKVSRGRYAIVDTDAARAADRAQRTSTPAPFVPCAPKYAAAADQARRESDIVTNALNGMTGQANFRGMPGKA